MTLPNKIRQTCLMMFCLFLVAIASCGKSGPPRYHLTGTVTYKGKQVPAGKLRFEPLGPIVNNTTIADAEIKDGKYSTLPDRGIIGGPQRVYVYGFNGVREPGSGPLGASVFEGYSVEIDLPEEASAFDIVVPEDVRALQPF